MDCGFKNPPSNRSLGNVLFDCGIYSSTTPSVCYTQQATVSHVPLPPKVQELTLLNIDK